MSHSHASWTCLRIVGPDSRQFLQGQLTNDVEQVTSGQAGLFALCNPKGRVLANFLLAVPPDAGRDELLFVLPSDAQEILANTLAKYIVFSKAELQSSCGWLAHTGLLERSTQNLPAGQDFACVAGQDGLLLRLQATRDELLWLAHQASPQPPGWQALDEQAWLLAIIRSGLGFVSSATSDQFLPQMLNMDLNKGVSFTKGCYTGQEIVARAKYRGQVKRRMYRLLLDSAIPPAPGSAVQTNSKSVGTVVLSAKNEAGQCELLAVLSNSSTDGALHIGQNSLTLLDLPYPVNEQL